MLWVLAALVVLGCQGGCCSSQESAWGWVVRRVQFNFLGWLQEIQGAFIFFLNFLSIPCGPHIFFLKKMIYFFLVCMSICLHVLYVHNLHAWCLARPDQGV